MEPLHYQLEILHVVEVELLVAQLFDVVLEELEEGIVVFDEGVDLVVVGVVPVGGVYFAVRCETDGQGEHVDHVNLFEQKVAFDSHGDETLGGDYAVA